MTALLFFIAALLVAVATRLEILSLLEVTFFEAMTVRYLLSLYPMTVAFVVLALASGVHAWKFARYRTATKEGSPCKR